MILDIELFIEDDLIDVGDPEDLRLAFNFSIADLQRLDGRATQGSRSYKFNVPATKNNRKTFGYSEDNNITNSFDHTSERDCSVYLSGSQVISGKARIQENRNEFGRLGSYKIAIIGDNATWINSIKELSLTDLDFSDQNHTLDVATVDASETISNNRDYIYPLINYGQWDFVSGDNLVSLEDRYPAIKVRSYLDKIFQNQGLTIKSDFLDSNEFSNLIIPFSGKNFDEVLDESFRNDRLFRANFEGSTYIAREFNYITLRFSNDSTNGNFDNGGLYSPSSGFYTVDTPSFQEFVFNYDFKLTEEIAPNVFQDVADPLKVAGFEFAIEVRKGGVGSFTQLASIAGIISGTGVTGALNPDNITTGLIEFDTGDEIRVTLRHTSANFSDAAILPDDLENNYFYNNIQLSYAPNSLVELNNYVPDINQLDLITDLRDEFNLYFLTNLERGEVIIEPRDSFFRGEAIDWTSKLNGGLKNSYLGANLNKTLQLKYVDDDTDIFLKNFKEDREIELGALDISIDNVSAKSGLGKKSLKVFSPTFMRGADSIGLRNNRIPTLVNSTGAPQKKTSYNPRILYYHGAVSLSGSDSWNFEGNSRTTYPKATFYDDTFENDFSLLYNDRVNQSGLFERHHSNLYETINTSRVSMGEFYLTPADIEAFDFRNPIVILQNGEPVFYTVNLIKEYNPLGSGLTKVELVKIINPIPRAQITVTDNILPPNPPSPPPAGGNDLKASIGGITTTVKFKDTQGFTQTVKF